MISNCLNNIKRLTCTSFLMCTLFSFSQTEINIQDLKKSIKENSSQKEKSSLSNKIAKHYNNKSQSDSAKLYLKKAFKYGENLSEKEKLSLYHTSSIINYKIGEYKQGLKDINKVIIEVEKDTELTKTLEFAEYLYSRASFNQVLENPIKSIQDINRSLKINKTNPNLKAKSYSVLSTVYHNIGDKTKALAIANKIREKPLVNEISKVYLAKSYLLTSAIFEENKDFKKALEYERLALYIYKQEQNLLGIASTQSNIAHSLHQLGKYGDALVILNESEEQNKTLKNKYVGAAINLNKAENYAALKDYTKAYALFKLSKKQFITLGIQAGVCESLLEESKLLYSQNKIKEAITLGEKSLKIAKINKLIYLEESNYLNLYNIYKIKEGSTKALFYHEKYAETKDKILKEDKVKSLANLKIQNDVTNLENKIEVQSNQLKASTTKEKDYLIIKVLLALSVLSLLFLIYKQYRSNKTKAKVNKIEKEFND